MKIVTIVGTRPQLIKAAVVTRALQTRVGVDEVLVNTGQHYDPNLSAIFFDEQKVASPAYQLNVGPGSQGSQTGRMLEAIEGVLTKESPDWVLVYGDTNSTLAGALAAAKLHIKVAHVEAGLRSFNRRMPEEINRTLTDHLSEILFAPTENACRNLEREGLHRGRVVGDVMYDSFRLFSNEALRVSRLPQSLGLENRRYILATLHRQENTDCSARLGNLLGALARASDRRPVVLPLHPRTKAAIAQSPGLAALAARLIVIDPVRYFDMLALESQAGLIVTDSGGVQKEAFFFKVPCLTCRDETEWIELVESGWNRLVSPVSEVAVTEAIENSLQAGPGRPCDIFGNGHAAELVADALVGATGVEPVTSSV